MLKRFFVLLTLFMLLPPPIKAGYSHFTDSYAASDLPIDSLLHVLDKEIKVADSYIAHRVHSIDSAKAIYYSQSQPIETAIYICKQYVCYQSDSALTWMDRVATSNGGELPECLQFDYLFICSNKAGKRIDHNYDTVYAETNDRFYSINTFYRARDLGEQGDTLSAIYYLAIASINDVRCGITDNGAIWRLAAMLYERQDIHRAYDYIEYSCHNSDIYNVPVRYVEMAPIAHGIAREYRRITWTTIQWLWRAIAIGVVTIVLLIISVLYSIREKRQLKQFNRMLSEAKAKQEAVNRELSEMNRTREQYICAYLEEQSVQIRRTYKDNLKAGKPDAEERYSRQIEQYCHNFDTTFLRLFPNFVQRFNSLLRLDAQIQTKPGEMTPELRIFALIRLGINKSTRISDLLCLSPNTVYNYRSRVRANALNRDEFETIVRNL